MPDMEKKAVDPRMLAMNTVDHGIAAMERQLLSIGVPAETLANMMMNHSASVIALIDPPDLRAQVMKRLIQRFPEAVRAGTLAASTTKGGVILPHAELREESVGGEA